jgi:hypothetical protein
VDNSVQILAILHTDKSTLPVQSLNPASLTKKSYEKLATITVGLCPAVGRLQ